MLMMKCPECEKYICSELLAEIPRIACEHCGCDVTVANILVSSNGFTFDRNDLLKRFFRYRKLLDEVLDERDVLTGRGTASADSRRSIEQFLGILQGMMTGARSKFRYQFLQPTRVLLRYGQHQYPGEFVNLSMEGACVETPSSHPLPVVKNSIALGFRLPEGSRDLECRGTVCWTEKGRVETRGRHRCGIRFSGLAPEVRDDLWLFISSAVGLKAT